jgi:hypothetical protein
VSIPRQTLLRLAPAPSGPLDAVAVLSLPLWGGLLCFAAAVAAANSWERVAVARPVNVGDGLSAIWRAAGECLTHTITLPRQNNRAPLR